MLMRLAQVVFTLTQFPTVDGVNFKLDGKAIDVLGGEGIIIDHPMSRADYEDMSPAILVESPTVGNSVSSPCASPAPPTSSKPCSGSTSSTGTVSSSRTRW